jgi:hypothetical protein
MARAKVYKKSDYSQTKQPSLMAPRFDPQLNTSLDVCEQLLDRRLRTSEDPCAPLFPNVCKAPTTPRMIFSN